MQENLLIDILVFAGLMTTLGCFTGVLVTFLKRKSYRLPVADFSARLDDIVERLTRLETSVDATALEVERISEGQRFTTRLLADSHGASAFGEGRRGGSQTPQ
ncbi:MAG TPA: hypothetical protein VL383_08910 [Gemmatimonadaceae bacterium]|nr:hypothetical protein [Gemmatimonadaceae bacterium]